MLICLVMFTGTNALRGALFRTGKRFWSSGEYDPYISFFKPDKSLETVIDSQNPESSQVPIPECVFQIGVVDNNPGNRNAMSNIRGIKKMVYLQ
uniref:Uncharacterized protein n=1 Tax=Setaria digitata TaxID=48799 RepID=A0A915PWT8_9BILA